MLACMFEEFAVSMSPSSAFVAYSNDISVPLTTVLSAVKIFVLFNVKRIRLIKKKVL